MASHPNTAFFHFPPLSQLVDNVDPIPDWARTVVAKLEDKAISPREFVEQVVINVYHDQGSGLGVHQDPKELFNRPIYSIRLFSDSVLSFGCRGLGMVLRKQAIPLPRGAITVMEGYAANKAKHCVRPSDTHSKSASLLLRSIHAGAKQDLLERKSRTSQAASLATPPKTPVKPSVTSPEPDNIAPFPGLVAPRAEKHLLTPESPTQLPKKLVPERPKSPSPELRRTRSKDSAQISVSTLAPVLPKPIPPTGLPSLSRSHKKNAPQPPLLGPVSSPTSVPVQVAAPAPGTAPLPALVPPPAPLPAVMNTLPPQYVFRGKEFGRTGAPATPNTRISSVPSFGQKQAIQSPHPAALPPTSSLYPQAGTFLPSISTLDNTFGRLRDDSDFWEGQRLQNMYDLQLEMRIQQHQQRLSTFLQGESLFVQKHTCQVLPQPFPLPSPVFQQQMPVPPASYQQGVTVLPPPLGLGFGPANPAFFGAGDRQAAPPPGPLPHGGF